MSKKTSIIRQLIIAVCMTDCHCQSAYDPSCITDIINMLLCVISRGKIWPMLPDYHPVTPLNRSTGLHQKHEDKLLLKWADCTTYIRSQKESGFPEWLQSPCYGDAAISIAIQSTLGYDTAIRSMWLTTASRIYAFKTSNRCTYIYIYRQLLMISYRLVIVLSNGTIPDPLRRTV